MQCVRHKLSMIDHLTLDLDPLFTFLIMIEGDKRLRAVMDSHYKLPMTSGLDVTGDIWSKGVVRLHACTQ